MRQLSLSAVLCSDKTELHLQTTEKGPLGASPLECYDLFCGCGGWSTGAVQAGHRVVFACDANAAALEAHAANHPNAKHQLLELPCDNLPFPTDGRPFHCHGSPPCTMFSTVRTKGEAGSTVQAATDLVEWYLNTALTCGATSWSMEQVPALLVLKVVRRIRSANLARMDYGVFDLEDLGVPQKRKRLIAGSPGLIARLKRLSAQSRRRSVRDVIHNARGTHVRHGKRWETARLRHMRKPGESKYVYSKSSNPLHGCLPVSGPAPTVLTTGQLNWVDKRQPEAKPQPLNVSEIAALQTFPADFVLPQNRQDACKLVGNAVPPLVARLLMSKGAPTLATKRF